MNMKLLKMHCNAWWCYADDAVVFEIGLQDDEEEEQITLLPR